ncbi:MAG: aminomethyl-transferring glycine dehydrogenase subunit GcvPA [Victivallaceae bacterium]|nr:aminomethyl-transferring glycine dehydrogenase subunit GcvPA [Victivallaceae bacterium]
MPYIANTDADRQVLLETIGCRDFAEMWQRSQVVVPEPPLANIPSGMSEFEVLSKLRRLAAKNAADLHIFLGAGYYDHIIPAAVGEITGRSEFYTAYTPYQPEASQGTLQAIYEYQSMICRLTGMPVANASLYDGGTALFEAMMLAIRATRRRQVVVSEAVSPIFRTMLHTYSRNLNIDLIQIPAGTADSNQRQLLNAVSDRTAGVIVQYPNFFGTIEDWEDFNAQVHAKKALTVGSTYPVALALLTPPGELGFDIVTAEGQSLGSHLNFGGPYLGVMAVTETLMRKMPGRVCGRTADAAGKPGFVLTLQTREQHIRRENAMSNICSNENLCALTALVYLACVGKQGLVQVAELCAAKAAYARELLLAIDGVEAVGGEAFFNEFVIKLPGDAAEAVGKMIDKGFAAGFPLGIYYPDRKDQLLVAVTEKRTKEEIKALATALEAVL